MELCRADAAVVSAHVLGFSRIDIPIVGSLALAQDAARTIGGHAGVGAGDRVAARRRRGRDPSRVAPGPRQHAPRRAHRPRAPRALAAVSPRARRRGGRLACPQTGSAPRGDGSAAIEEDTAAQASTVIAIVGAGLGGLSAALTLDDAGVPATVYEASGSVGGRVHSNASGYWRGGQISEWCGELINTDHQTMLRMARRFGLATIDLH